MKIDNKYKVRSVADKNIVILQGEYGADTTKVLSLNKTALWLWNSFFGEDSFSKEDVIKALVNHYNIDETLAKKDAEQWIKAFSDQNVITED